LALRGEIELRGILHPLKFSINRKDLSKYDLSLVFVMLYLILQTYLETYSISENEERQLFIQKVTN
jgi:hypothetical protein